MPAMKRSACRLALAAVLAMSVGAQAETIEVRMLNRGEHGSMAYEPDYVALKPGDWLKFVAANQSHNAASIDGMVPERYAGFKGRINEEIEVRFDQPGFYGIKCSPHYGMGMVMVVRVGEVSMPESFRGFDAPPRARKRFDEIFARNGLSQ
ncbi:pseudoazurin [Mesorhizobium ephedrae]|uniref:Pseudoazurin n=2 Tax=Kumtagia ephedrae TaxID=2116701 RepID=A0A2P7RXU2_9HYPH|nr:pseudoazurin [Mesorhizobium ephedrae]PSJ54972.1 pseudoazurin [Mesorhizobium ephedrae]